MLIIRHPNRFRCNDRTHERNRVRRAFLGISSKRRWEPDDPDADRGTPAVRKRPTQICILRNLAYFMKHRLTYFFKTSDVSGIASVDSVSGDVQRRAIVLGWSGIPFVGARKIFSRHCCDRRNGHNGKAKKSHRFGYLQRIELILKADFGLFICIWIWCRVQQLIYSFPYGRYAGNLVSIVWQNKA